MDPLYAVFFALIGLVAIICLWQYLSAEKPTEPDYVSTPPPTEEKVTFQADYIKDVVEMGGKEPYTRVVSREEKEILENIQEAGYTPSAVESAYLAGSGFGYPVMQTYKQPMVYDTNKPIGSH